MAKGKMEWVHFVNIGMISLSILNKKMKRTEQRKMRVIIVLFPSDTSSVEAQRECVCVTSLIRGVKCY